MACYHPVPAFQDRIGSPVLLWPHRATGESWRTPTFSLPCGHCLGCRKDRATEWARRCSHEAGLWDHNIFLTLTYDDSHLPTSGHLQGSALTKFFKRLRRSRDRGNLALNSDRSASLRYFACGEYGGVSSRPHYHALIFNCGFTDTRPVGKNLWESESLNKLWPYGFAAFGPATPAAANYIAKYSLKRSAGEWRYEPAVGYSLPPGVHGPVEPSRPAQEVNDATGEVRPAPFLRMSLKPAIGHTWLDRFSEDLSGGYLVTDGVPGRIPQAYKRRIQQNDEALAQRIELQLASRRVALGFMDDRLPARLADAEKIHQRKVELNEARAL